MIQRRAWLGLIVGALLMPEVGEAQAGKWTARGSLAWVGSSGDDLAAFLPTGEAFRFSVDDGLGVALELERQLKSGLGIELSVLRAELDSEIAIASAGSIFHDSEESTFDLFALGANYHFQPVRNLDLDVGLFAAMITFDDVIFLTEIGRRDKLVFDDDIGFGLKLGLERPFGASERWLVCFSLRYLSAILEGETAGQDADLDPTILAVGVGYRF